mgnify:CR=1 FL=1
MLHIHNTLTRKKELFTPIDKNNVRLYVCGITPYDTTHMGHAMTYLTFDVLNESLWRLALEAEGELGLREAIEDRYSRLVELLDQRLGLEPAKETRVLYLRLLSQT